MKFLLFACITIFGLITYVKSASFDITNQAGGPVWIGILGNPGKDIPNGGGFVLESGQQQTVEVADDWIGRVWGRSYCDASTNHCETGDCGDKLECNGAGGVPPATLVEITFKGDGGKDFYDVSLVDGFNLQASVEPVDGQSDGGDRSCAKSACMVDLNANCPEDLQVTSDAGVIACKSSCLAHDTDEDCCRNGHDTTETCPAPPGAAYFKQQCPDAYSYAYDDPASLLTCVASKYNIIFA